MNNPSMIAAREELRSLASYLFEAATRAKISGILTPAFTIESMVNMAATLMKAVVAIESSFEPGTVAPPSVNPPVSPPAQAPYPPAPASNGDLSKSVQDFMAQVQRWTEQIRAQELEKLKKQYEASKADLNVEPVK